MEEQETYFSRHNPFYILLLVVILLFVIVFLSAKQNDAENSDEVSESSEQKEDAAVVDPQNIPAPPSTEDQPTVAENNLNPPDCPPSDDGFVHIDTQTGECLEEDLLPSNINEQESGGPETLDTLDVLMRAIGEDFDFPRDLSVRADSFTCETIGQQIQSSSGNKDLGYIMENLRKYQDDSLPLSERLSADSSIPYDYIVAFDDYLTRSQVKQSTEEISDYFELYQECTLQLTIRNVGQKIVLPDGCGLSLERNVLLDDISGKRYTARNLRHVVCTKALVDFPFGATGKDKIYFILPTPSQPAYIFFNSVSSDGQPIVLIEL